MDKDCIDKIECLIGYLEKWHRTDPMNVPSELPEVIQEANEWIESLKS